MKYILMMNTMRAGSRGMDWPEPDIKAHIRYMMDLNRSLSESGNLVGAEALAWPSEAKLVCAGKHMTRAAGLAGGPSKPSC